MKVACSSFKVKVDVQSMLYNVYGLYRGRESIQVNQIRCRETNYAVYSMMGGGERLLCHNYLKYLVLMFLFNKRTKTEI